MKFLAHRGLWNQRHEQNTLASFRAALANGFGLETDIRDFGNTLRIAHDIPTGNEPHFEELLEILQSENAEKNLPIAINIKADGLAKEISARLPQTPCDWQFFFDMSVPDQRAYQQLNMPIYTRMSEVEKQPAWFESSVGVWLDQFEGVWFDEQLIQQLINNQKKVCIVSSELHSRAPEPLWELLQTFAANENVMLCTDFPAKAQQIICG